MPISLDVLMVPNFGPNLLSSGARPEKGVQSDFLNDPPVLRKGFSSTSDERRSEKDVCAMNTTISHDDPKSEEISMNIESLDTAKDARRPNSTSPPILRQIVDRDQHDVQRWYMSTYGAKLIGRIVHGMPIPGYVYRRSPPLCAALYVSRIKIMLLRVLRISFGRLRTRHGHQLVALGVTAENLSEEFKEFSRIPRYQN